MLRLRRRLPAIALTAATLALVAASGAGSATTAGRAQATTPAWFLPIWDAYGRNPAVTPEFDFARLYSAG
jgi:hypothetical protein